MRGGSFPSAFEGSCHVLDSLGGGYDKDVTAVYGCILLLSGHDTIDYIYIVHFSLGNIFGLWWEGGHPPFVVKCQDFVMA